MPSIQAIRTGLVKLRRPTIERRGTGPARVAHMLFDEEWTEWLPIYAWVIEHEEGIIVVDTGETSRVHERGYFPRWHPFYRCGIRFSVHPEEEIGPQLRARGIAARDVRQIVMTHLHTDHVGGLIHLLGSTIWVARRELQRAKGLWGGTLGYLPHRWPRWWRPEFLHFDNRPFAAFPQTMALTKRGDVLVVPTPGHTPHHVSVVVCGSPSYFLAGDTTYNQQLLLADKTDGVTPNEPVSRQTFSRIMALAKQTPLVYLPSHDPQSEERLTKNSVLEQETERNLMSKN